MTRRFLVPVPSRAFHGTTDSVPLADGMPPARDCHWFTRVDWRKHDSWMGGGPHLEEGIPYANIVWEAIGLRDRKERPDGVPEWARDIRNFTDLARDYGILFFTDREADAGRYGECLELDLSSPDVVDVVEDPHVRTHRGWIAIVRAGAPVPFVDPPAPKPM